MAQTARYCIPCLLALTPYNTRTPEDQVILSVIGVTTTGSPNYEKNHKIAGGLCQKCGKDSVLIYYELPD